MERPAAGHHALLSGLRRRLRGRRLSRRAGHADADVVARPHVVAGLASDHGVPRDELGGAHAVHVVQDPAVVFCRDQVEAVAAVHDARLYGLGGLYPGGRAGAG